MDAEPDAEFDAELDAELDAEVDAELEVKLDAAHPSARDAAVAGRDSGAADEGGSSDSGCSMVQGSSHAPLLPFALLAGVWGARVRTRRAKNAVR